MPSTTWRRAALSSNARALSGLCWRIVEAQHHVSTLKLVDTLDEQRLLEGLIEGTKPMVPPECRHLHYLLFTPFRYGAVYPNGSRFRRAGITEGVFYAAEAVESAIAEMTFHRLLFFAELAAHALATEPSRIHRICCRVQNEEGDRPDTRSLYCAQRSLVRSGRLPPVPSARRDSSDRRNRDHPLSVGPRSQARGEPCLANLSRL